MAKSQGYFKICAYQICKQTFLSFIVFTEFMDKICNANVIVFYKIYSLGKNKKQTLSARQK